MVVFSGQSVFYCCCVLLLFAQREVGSAVWDHGSFDGQLMVKIRLELRYSGTKKTKKMTFSKLSELRRSSENLASIYLHCPLWIPTTRDRKANQKNSRKYTNCCVKRQNSHANGSNKHSHTHQYLPAHLYGHTRV